MSGSPIVDYKAMVREEWTGGAPYWKKWHNKLAAQSRAATELVVETADLSPGLHVLDLASGTGEPALSVAKAVGPAGRVVATDLISSMLEALAENARAQGVTQIDTRLADAENLPFADAEFDRVTCRFGLMFFPDIPRALGGVRRVLKTGGRCAFVVWGSLAENPLFATTLGPFLKRVNPPPPPPDAPSVFRFADEAKLAGVLQAARFREVKTSKRSIVWAWPGPPEEAWMATREIAAPFHKLIAALPSDQAAQAVAEVLEALRPGYDGSTTSFPATVLSATGLA